MGWKDNSYTKRGMLIGLIIALPFLFLGGAAFLGRLFSISFGYYLDSIFAIASSFIFCLLVGSFLGWIYGKSKKIGLVLIIVFSIIILFFIFQPFLSNFYYQRASTNSNADLCAWITGNNLRKNQCYEEIAIATNDSTLCDKMQVNTDLGIAQEQVDNYYKNECYSTVKYNLDKLSK